MYAYANLEALKILHVQAYHLLYSVQRYVLKQWVKVNEQFTLLFIQNISPFLIG